jgi:hypothetical protein
MNKSIWIAASLALTILTQVAGEETPDFATLARRYRIEVYNAYHTDRAEYDQLQELGRMAEWMYLQAENNTSEQATLSNWLISAHQSVQSQTELPSLPGQDQYPTLEEFAASIQFDKNSVKWLDQPKTEFAQDVRERRSTNQASTAVPSSSTPADAVGVPSQSRGAATPAPTQVSKAPQPRGSVLSRVLGAVTGSDEAGPTSGSPSSNPVTTTSVTPQTVAPSLSGSDPELAMPTGPIDNAGSGTFEAELSAGATGGSDVETELKEQEEVIRRQAELLAEDSLEFDTEEFELQTNLMEVWYQTQNRLEGHLSSPQYADRIGTLREDAMSVTKQLLERGVDMLIDAEDSNDTTAAHQAELDVLRSSNARLEKLISDAN